MLTDQNIFDWLNTFFPPFSFFFSFFFFANTFVTKFCPKNEVSSARIFIKMHISENPMYVLP